MGNEWSWLIKFMCHWVISVSHESNSKIIAVAWQTAIKPSGGPIMNCLDSLIACVS